MHWSLIGQAPEGATRLSYKKEFFLRMVAAGVCDMVGGRGDIQWVLDKETKKLYFVYPCKLYWKSRKEIIEWFQTEGKTQIDKAIAWLDETFPDKKK